MECVAIKGIGKDHAKWIPVSVANYQFIPKIKIDKKRLHHLTKNQKLQIINSCPKKVFKYNNLKKEIEIENLQDCMFCKECVIKCQDFDARKGIKISQSDRQFIFTVETTGVLSPEEIVKRALKVLREKIEVVKRDLKDQKQIIDINEEQQIIN